LEEAMYLYVGIDLQDVRSRLAFFILKINLFHLNSIFTAYLEWETLTLTGVGNFLEKTTLCFYITVIDVLLM
ncbi:hypothetical protein ACJX0J_037817, partial [Zea mays]